MRSGRRALCPLEIHRFITQAVIFFQVPRGVYHIFPILCQLSSRFSGANCDVAPGVWSG